MAEVNFYFGVVALTLVRVVLAGGLIYVLLSIPRIADVLERIANRLDKAADSVDKEGE